MVFPYRGPLDMELLHSGPVACGSLLRGGPVGAQRCGKQESEGRAFARRGIQRRPAQRDRNEAGLRVPAGRSHHREFASDCPKRRRGDGPVEGRERYDSVRGRGRRGGIKTDVVLLSERETGSGFQKTICIFFLTRSPGRAKAEARNRSQKGGVGIRVLSRRGGGQHAGIPHVTHGVDTESIPYIPTLCIWIIYLIH